MDIILGSGTEGSNGYFVEHSLCHCDISLIARNDMQGSDIFWLKLNLNLKLCHATSAKHLSTTSEKAHFFQHTAHNFSPQPYCTTMYTDKFLNHLQNGPVKTKLANWLRSTHSAIKKANNNLTKKQILEILCYLFPKKAQDESVSIPHDFPYHLTHPPIDPALKQTPREPDYKTIALNFDLFFPNFQPNESPTNAGVQPIPMQPFNFPPQGLANIVPDDEFLQLIDQGIQQVNSRSSQSSISHMSDDTQVNEPTDQHPVAEENIQDPEQQPAPMEAAVQEEPAPMEAAPLEEMEDCGLSTGSFSLHSPLNSRSDDSTMNMLNSLNENSSNSLSKSSSQS